MTKKITPFQLPVSGVTVNVVGVSKISMMLRLRKANPKPLAPMVEVEIGGQVSVERNEADPDYIEALKLWDTFIGVDVMDSMLQRIAVVQHLSEEDQAEVNELRTFLVEEELPESDKLLWLMECAIGGDEDFKALIDKSAGQADPSQEGVNQASNNFRRPVQES